MALTAVNAVLSLYWLVEALTTRTELHEDRLVVVSLFRRREYRRGGIVDIERRCSSFAQEYVLIRHAGGEDRSPNVEAAAGLADAIRKWMRSRA